MAAAAGKKSTTSLSLLMEAYGLEVEEELSTMAIPYWAEGAWTRNGTLSKKKLGSTRLPKFRCARRVIWASGGDNGIP